MGFMALSQGKVSLMQSDHRVTPSEADEDDVGTVNAIFPIF